MDSERSVLAELLRLYDWRFELARMEKEAKTLPETKQVGKLLGQYGREKKAAWEAARRVLSIQSESAPIVALRRLLACIDDCKGHGTPIIKDRAECYAAMAEAQEALK